MQEIWKDIKGYEGYYKVSNFGNVKSLKRFRVKNDRILKGTLYKVGYLVVVLNNGKFKRREYIHRLVAEAFVANKRKVKTVNHIDGCKTNNIFTNLEWCTQSENVKHAHHIGIAKVGIGEKQAHSKLTKIKVMEIRRKYKTGDYLQEELAKEYGVKSQSISDIILRKTWKHI